MFHHHIVALKMNHNAFKYMQKHTETSAREPGLENVIPD